MTPGIKDLELCLAATYFANQSTLINQSKSESSAMVYD
jgi:hypothetical protein